MLWVCVLQFELNSNYSEILPFISLGHLPGMAGLFVAGVFSGALSSVSATLNSLAAVTLEDYIKPLYKLIKGKPWESKSATITKHIALTYGVICIGGAFLAQFLGGILQASLVIFGVVGGPLLSLFTLGMFTEYANELGVIPGLVSGIAVAIWISFGQPRPTKPGRQLEFSTEDCSKFGGMQNKTSFFTEPKAYENNFDQE